LMMIRYARNLLPPTPRSTGPAIPRGGWMAA
jgi:hypothetical protein